MEPNRLVDTVTNTQVALSTNGIFANVADGAYWVYLYVNNYCGTYYDAERQLVVISSLGGPQFTRRVGLMCEDALGNPTSGSAYFSMAGPTPRKLEIKESTSSTWSVITENNYANDTVIGNLSNNVIYDLRVSSCGQSNTTQVTISQMAQLNMDGTAMPCIGQSYTLSLPDYPGATFEWKNPNGIVVSNSKDFLITNYATSYDGTYTGTITWGSCLTREIEISIYGYLCGTLTTRTTITGNVFHDNNGQTDGMVNGTGTASAGAENVYVSLIDADGEIAATVQVASNGSYEFKGIPAGNYEVLVTTNATGSTTSTFPTTTWDVTGENHGLPTILGNDGTVDGKQLLTVGNTDIDNVNFGIQERPVSYDRTKNVNGVPTLTNLGDVPLQGSDADAAGSQPTTQSSWAGHTVVIDVLPTNGFVLKYDGVDVVAGQTITNYNPALLTIEPGATTGFATTTVFHYHVIDIPGAASVPSTYTVIFSQALPVELVRFEGRMLSNCVAALTWESASEINTAAFLVQKSRDGVNFETIQSVTAKGAHNNYEAFDAQVIKGFNYYRLNAVDFDGSNSFSKVLQLNSDCTGLGSISIYPTITKGKVYISGISEGATVEVSNVLGQVVKKMVSKSANATLQLHNLPAGNYMVVVKDSAGAVSVKVVKH